MRNRVIIIVLSVLMFLPLMLSYVPVTTGAVQSDMQSSIEDQIRAYATSIDMPDADDDAAWILAMHGVMMGGRTMYADECDALTATLLNSNLLPMCLADACANLITQMQSVNRTSQHAMGSCQWYAEDNHYRCYTDPNNDGDYFKEENKIADFTGVITYNSYDSSLDWIAGSAHLDFTVIRETISKGSAVYVIDLTVSDEFNFNHNQAGNVSTEIMSLLGSAMFREFRWESTVTFELTVPNDCAHESFTEETVNPTCTTPGGVKHSCAACGYSYYTDETPAHGHDWGSYKSNNDATCQHDGTKTATCKTCGETKTVTDEDTKKGHDWSGATCLYPKTCLTCGETTGEYGGHDWEEASCFKAKTCKLCGETEGEPISHEWKEATCDRAK